MRVDQYLPSFAPHDAIGEHALQVRRALSHAGYDARLWAAEIHSSLAGEAADFRQDTERGHDRLLLYQCSTNSELASWLGGRAEQGERLLSQYHNITPARYFERWDREAARAMSEAREELKMLAPRVELAMAVSAFNERDLIGTGYANVVVCPLLVDLDQYHRPPRAKTLDRLRRRNQGCATQWLFVGRFAPNKCQHDLIGAFAAYRHSWDRSARLSLVGWSGQPRYLLALQRLCHELDLGDSIEFVHAADDADLLAYWAVADVFVCMSEHEGFCVPVLEAMELGAPVVAYNAAGVRETLGGAGIVVDDKAPGLVAAAVRDAREPARRQELIAAGRSRAADFTIGRTSARLLEIIDKLSQ